MYLSQLLNVFVQAAKNICPNRKREYAWGILMDPGLICGEASGSRPEWTHLRTPSILRSPQKDGGSEIDLWRKKLSLKQCVFYKQTQFDLILSENSPFLVHLYAWASPQARSLCICKQHEDAFVLQNWLSHGKIHSVEIKSKIIISTKFSFSC